MNIYFIAGEGGDLLRTVNEEARRAKKVEIMENASTVMLRTDLPAVRLLAWLLQNAA